MGFDCAVLHCESNNCKQSTPYSKIVHAQGHFALMILLIASSITIRNH